MGYKAASLEAGITPEGAASLGPLKVEVDGVLPSDRNTAKDLNAGARTEKESFRSGGLSHRNFHCDLRRSMLGGVGSRIDSGTRALDVEKHLSTVMLNRLKAADGPTELVTIFGVFDREIQASLSPTEAFCRAEELGTIQDLLDVISSA